MSSFTAPPSDAAYGAGWNGSLAAPTQNAVYDKIETLGSGGANPGGTGSQLQYRVDGTTFGGVSGSSVSGADVGLSGTDNTKLTIAKTGSGYSSAGSGGGALSIVDNGTSMFQFYPNYVDGKATIVIGSSSRAGAFDFFAYRSFGGDGDYDFVTKTKAAGSDFAERMRITGNTGTATVSFSNSDVSVSGSLTAASLNLGGATLLDVLTATAVEDVPSLSAGSYHYFNITVTGAAAGNAVFLGLPAVTGIDSLDIRAWCAGADTVSVTVFNDSSSTVDLDSGTWRAVVLKF